MSKDIKLSNIKGLLIFLVVFGHLIAPYQRYYNELYLFIYSFHMPLFILVSGYFAKRVSLKKVINLLLLLLIFQPLYRGFLVLLNPEKTFKLRMEVPYFHLWFLLAMIFWYLIAIMINKLRLKDINKLLILFGFFIIGIAAKFIAEPFEAYMKNYDRKFISDSFSYMRTLSFLPYFFLGFFLPKESMPKLYHSLKGNKIIPILTTAGVFLYLALSNTSNEEKIMKGNYGIDQMDGSLMFRISHILMVYVIALVMCYILLHIISDKNNFLTRLGERTLPVFLFHAFFSMISKKIVFLQNLNPWILLPVLFLSAVAIVLVLSSDTFIQYTYYLWNPLELFKTIARKFQNTTGRHL